MTRNLNNQFTPDYAVPPGKTLEESMAATGINQTELAQRTGLTRKTINGIINGREPITPDTAILLEKIFRVPARFWNNFQTNYDEAMARLREQERLRQYSNWPKQQGIPVKELINRGLIPPLTDPIELVSALLRFFGVASPAEYESVWSEIQEAYAFRKSDSHRTEFGAITAWLRIGEIEAQKIQCQKYGKDKLKDALPILREQVVKDVSVFQHEIRRICTECGVAVVYVPGIPGAPIYGATRWLNPARAILQLSLRGKDDGNLWFSFFHEIGHILIHGKRDIFLELEKARSTEQEVEADCFARDVLIPPDQCQAFVSRYPMGKISKADIQSFARQIGVTPGIVVGRLQNEMQIPYSHCNDLKLRFKFV